MALTRDQDTGPTGPSDKEVVALLQRLASARAHLIQAEQAADDAAPDAARAAERNDDIEEAHTELLWAQAQFITAAKEDRARRAVDAAKLKERQVLRRFGFSSFRDYLTARTSVPTTDVHLEVARREFESAQADWDLIAQELADAEVVAPATVVLDLTGDNPRRIA
jgi:hypothetical protein